MTSDHLGELSTDRLRLWKLILSETQAACDFPFLGRSDIFYERLVTAQSNQAGFVPRVEDPVLVQIRFPVSSEAYGAIFLLNTGDHAVQRSYSLAELGLNESMYLYRWQDQTKNNQAISRIALTLPGHHSALYFFSPDPIEDIPLRLPA